MDQQAFRSLISSSSSSSSADPSSSKPRVFGASQKRSAGGSSSSTSSKDLFAPRKKTPANKDRSTPRPPPKNSATGETYVDRAKARRVGKEDEDYSDVNRLAEEWRAKWNAAQSEEERRDIEEQMAFLGGDARHSILVKGLDHSLLAQQKAKEAGGEGDVDDHLERAYDEAATKASSPELRRDEEGGGASPSGTTGEKRSRESVIEALKRRKLASAQASSAAGDEADERQQARDAEFERAKKLGKFKPITAGASNGGFKPVEADQGEVIITRDGKRLRKKKKKAPEEQGEQSATATEEATAAAHHPNAVTEKGRIRPGVQDAAKAASPSSMPSLKRPTVSPSRPSPPPPAVAERESSKPSAMSPLAPSPLGEAHSGGAPPVSSTGAGADIEDDDDDIFADAGRWEGLPDDDSEDDEGGSEAQRDRLREGPVASVSANASLPKGNWFGEEDKAGGQTAGGAALPAGLNQLLSSVQHGATTSEGSQAEAEQGADEPPESTGRLQGLSTSSLPSNVSRMLLHAEQEEARKAEEKEKGWWKKKKDRKRKKAEGEGSGAEDGEAE